MSYRYAYRPASTIHEMYRFTTPLARYHYWSGRRWHTGVSANWKARSREMVRIPDSAVLLRGADV